MTSNVENYKGVLDGRLGFGQKAAVLVIDFTKAYTTPSSPFYCNGQGFGVTDAIREAKPLIELARSKGVPIIYTKMFYEHPTDGGVFAQKVPLLRTWRKDNPLVEIDDSIKPCETDIIIVKQYPSTFFGTNVACNLRAIHVDTCIIVGCSTSGCIRSSVLDGMQYGFRCIVPRECVGDRTQSIHEANLFDMNAKNGDVLSKKVVMDYLNSLGTDMSSRPSKRLCSEQADGAGHVPCGVEALQNLENYQGVFDGKLGFGRKVALIVIDFTKAYVTPSSPFYCNGRGFGVTDAIKESKPLIELCRSKGVPIVYTQVCYGHPSDGGVFTQKIALLRTWTKENPMVEIEESIAPHQGDNVIVKQYPSAFFGTNLACNLRAIDVDTCIIIGCSTSGCIRASVLDGMQHGFRCIVPRECVGDRTQSIHESNLFDINAKFGDVVDKSTVMEHVRFFCCAEATEGDTEMRPVTFDTDQVLPGQDVAPVPCLVFTVELNRTAGSSFGVDISAAGKVCMVNGIEEGSLVGEWNRKVTIPENQIRQFDRLMSLNGEKPAKGKDMLERLRDATGMVSILVQRPQVQKVQVSKNGKDLGLSVIDGQSFLLVTRITDGAISDHNASASPKDVVKVPSRIVSVNGKKGKGSELLKFMEEATSSFELEMLCYD
ncbi:Maleamate amidohydrolase (Nicotinate degradation protein F) [Durusdinium trenchii]|uniref:Maleamate amidohydrolase (Nicotinate degradation protein F) n=1 Tax=Durusdinium trenchii TaxID=1381693 RepID=A0ABP0NYC5_9DINO